MVELKTERLVLRPIGVADLETTHQYASNKELCKYMMFLPNDTIEETLDFLQAAQNEWGKSQPSSYEFAVCLDGKHIGAVSLAMESETSGELGWIIDEKYHGNGYCAEAAFALVDFAKSLGLTRLTASCDSRNTASSRVMEKIGMSFVCHVPRKYLDDRQDSIESQYGMDI